MKTVEEYVKLFGISNQLLENDLDRVERSLGLDLGRSHQKTLQGDDTYYPQIDRAVRAQAASMAEHYEVFYSLERTIRDLIADTLQATFGDSWWSSGRVPDKIKTEAEGRQQREIDTGMTPRSDRPLDFTTFGELGEIIKANWDAFGSIFNSQKAVERVMANLNSLRGPIAHCCPLAEDEVVRVRLTVRDWFRLME